MRVVGGALALLYGVATIVAAIGGKLSTLHLGLAAAAGALLSVGGVLVLADQPTGRWFTIAGAVVAIVAALVAGYALHGAPQPSHVAVRAVASVVLVVLVLAG